jgi:Holliday junction resolvase
MSPNKQKIKGTNWEREFVELLEKNIGDINAKRIAGSGAIGTSLGEPLLSGDVTLKFNDIPNTFRIECKTGYGGSTQLTLKKEWLDKIRQEAQNTYSIPALAGKFLGSRSGVKHFVVLDFQAFCDLIELIRKNN